MSDSFGGTIDQCCGVLKLDFSSAELAQLAVEKGFSQDTLNAVSVLFEYLRDKKEQTTIQTILRSQNARLIEHFRNRLNSLNT